MSAARPLDRIAILGMLFVCGTIGFNQLAAKVALAEVPPLTQAGFRSAAATLILGLATRWRSPWIFARDGTLSAGILIGTLFSLEFIALFLGLQWTSASHAVLFLYTAPFFVALGLKSVVPEEQLRPLQWGGLALSFAGVACALLSSVAISRTMLTGDLFCLVGGAFWGASTLVAKGPKLRRIAPVKVLLYQLAVSAVLISASAVVLGEHWPRAVSPLSAACLAYQLFIVCVTFFLWFWLLQRYRAGELSSFNFLTPLVGVATGWLILGDPIDAKFILGLLLVAAGIFMVNWPQRREKSVTPSP